MGNQPKSAAAKKEEKNIVRVGTKPTQKPQEPEGSGCC